jgi:uncharacterized membrane protein (UPF0127 family)
MPWLLHEDRVLATLEIAEGRRNRARGLLGRDGIEGALLLSPAKSIHTFRMRFPLDVAWCDGDMLVLRVNRVQPNRLPRPCPRAHCVIEAEAGAFERWGLTEGVELDVRR